MIIEQHYDEEVLAAFLEEPADSVSRDKHLASCGMCKNTLSSLRMTTTLLHEPAVWDSKPLSTAPRLETMAFLRGVAKTMKDEDAAAEINVKQLLAGSRETWSAKLAEHPEWRTAGMVRRLIKAREEAVNTVPADALQMSAMAVEIAEALEDNTRNRHLQGLAHYSHGYAVWYAGGVHEALAAFDRADERLCDVGSAEFDRALVGVMRSMIYQELERRDDALAISTAAAAVFARYADNERFAMARTTAAFTLQAAQRLREALAIHVQIAETATGDKWRSAALHNMALCYIELGELDRASDCLMQAIAGYERLGMMTFRSRVRWALADVFARQGRHFDALPLYTELRQEFEELEMANEVALLSLDMSESLLALGRHSEIGEVCKASLGYFAEAGLAHTEPALRGLAYLQEAAAAGRLTPAAIRGVRAFILAPTDQPERLFVEPPQ
jgi:tetratricopeptide (TPR) repeat protein